MARSGSRPFPSLETEASGCCHHCLRLPLRPQGDMVPALWNPALGSPASPADPADPWAHRGANDFLESVAHLGVGQRCYGGQALGGTGSGPAVSPGFWPARDFPNPAHVLPEETLRSAASKTQGFIDAKPGRGLLQSVPVPRHARCSLPPLVLSVESGPQGNPSQCLLREMLDGQAAERSASGMFGAGLGEQCLSNTPNVDTVSSRKRRHCPADAQRDYDFSELPREIIRNCILKKLSGDELASLGCCNQLLLSVTAAEEDLWKKLYELEAPNCDFCLRCHRGLGMFRCVKRSAIRPLKHSQHLDPCRAPFTYSWRERFIRAVESKRRRMVEDDIEMACPQGRARIRLERSRALFPSAVPRIVPYGFGFMSMDATS